MDRKEPYATEEEYNQRVIHYRDVPLIELGPGKKTTSCPRKGLRPVLLSQSPIFILPLTTTNQSRS